LEGILSLVDPQIIS
jgi:hypothetical protein